MEYVYHIVTIRVNETSWAHVWRLRSHYLRTGYDSTGKIGEAKLSPPPLPPHWGDLDPVGVSTPPPPTHTPLPPDG
jgi:hypothetical protein